MQKVGLVSHWTWKCKLCRQTHAKRIALERNENSIERHMLNYEIGEWAKCKNTWKTDDTHAYECNRKRHNAIKLYCDHRNWWHWATNNVDVDCVTGRNAATDDDDDERKFQVRRRRIDRTRYATFRPPIKSNRRSSRSAFCLSQIHTTNKTVKSETGQPKNSRKQHTQHKKRLSGPNRPA